MAHLAGSSKLLRAMNSTAALALLLERGRLTRGDLRAATGLSKPTVSDALRRLVEADLAIIAGHVMGGPGPNAEIYAINPDVGFAAGVSVAPLGLEAPGVAQVRAALCDVTGDVRARSEATVALGEHDLLDVVADVVSELVQAAGVDRDRVEHVQLGVAGAYDPTSQTVHHIDLPGFDQPGLVTRLAHRLGTGVDVDNDVNLAAIAERRHGRAAGIDAFALLWLGEGVGLAIDLHGSLLRGARGGAGEIGYLRLSPRDRPAADLQDLLGAAAIGRLAAAHGHAAPSVTDAVTAGCADPVFRAELAKRVALAVGVVVSVLDPALVVLAGPVGRAGGELLCATVAEAMRATALPDTPIAVTGLAEDPVVRGGLDAATAALHASLRARVGIHADA